MEFFIYLSLGKIVESFNSMGFWSWVILISILYFIWLGKALFEAPEMSED